MIRRIRLGHAPNCSSLGNVLNALVWTQAAVAALWVAAEAWPTRRKRKEPDGGETALVDEPAALVSTSDRPEGPVEAHVQVTRACGLPCPSCHIDPTADGAHVPLAEAEARFADLAARGVFRVALGGGEALRHPDLGALATAAKRHGLTVGLTTSGVGAARRLAELSAFDQVNVSLDGLGGTFTEARGYDGSDAALEAIRALAAVGVRVGVNIVLDRRTFPELSATVRAAVEAGARDVQLLRLKPAGRGTASYEARRLTPEQAWAIWPVARALLDEHPGVTFRVDCALVPFLAAWGVDAERLRAFGFLGCHGGDALLSVDTAGSEHPCSFVQDPVTPEWRRGVVTGPCSGCAYRALCRGGCHAVARHLTGELFAPDPECPIVAGSPRPQEIGL